MYLTLHIGVGTGEYAYVNTTDNPQNIRNTFQNTMLLIKAGVSLMFSGYYICKIRVVIACMLFDTSRCDPYTSRCSVVTNYKITVVR